MKIKKDNTKADASHDERTIGCDNAGQGNDSRSLLQRMVVDDKIITAIVFVNTIIIFINGYFPENRMLAIVDTMFTLFFLFEALVKIDPWSKGWSQGWKDYWSQNWNRFDFIILAFAIPSVGELFFDSGIHTNALLTLRCLRVFKLFKIFRRLPNHDNLLTGLKLAFKTSFYVIVSFLLFLIVFAVLSSALFEAYSVSSPFTATTALNLLSFSLLYTVSWHRAFLPLMHIITDFSESSVLPRTASIASLAKTGEYPLFVSRSMSCDSISISTSFPPHP
jgi:hypothetical protein